MGARRACPACNRMFTRGVRVQFASRTGLRPATVCQSCADGGVLIVQDNSADLTRCIECEDNAAVVCLACVAKKIREARGA